MSDNLEEDLRRARRADLLLGDDVFQDAWKQLEATIAEKWRASPARDAEGREELFRMQRAMDQLRIILDGYVQHGVIAREMLADEERDRLVGGMR